MNKEDRKSNNRNPFTTPEGYFENFHDRLMNSLPQSPRVEKPKRRSILPSSVSRWSYAAAVALIFIVGGTLLYNNNNADTQIAASHYDDSEYIEEFLDNYHIDEYTFYSYLTSTDTGF